MEFVGIQVARLVTVGREQNNNVRLNNNHGRICKIEISNNPLGNTGDWFRLNNQNSVKCDINSLLNLIKERNIYVSDANARYSITLKHLDILNISIISMDITQPPNNTIDSPQSRETENGTKTRILQKVQSKQDLRLHVTKDKSRERQLQHSRSVHIIGFYSG